MTAAPTVCLPARQLFEIADPSGVRIVCTAGSLWLTLDHDTRDVVLQPGDSFETGGPRRALLYAFEPAAFVLLAGADRGVRRSPGQDQAGGHRPPRVWAATRAPGSA